MIGNLYSVGNSAMTRKALSVSGALPLPFRTDGGGSLLEKIGAYWNRRAPSYLRQLNDNCLEKSWECEIISAFPRGTKRVLDVGTGPGFFAKILARDGYDVTAIDLSEIMLEHARKNAGALCKRIDFRRMDAQNLDFGDGVFDAVVSRNLTWNLEEPERAYGEWHRVLKKGGVLLNFDANWYSYLFDGEKAAEFDRDRDAVKAAGVKDCQDYCECGVMTDIARKLPLGLMERPGWDAGILKALGFSSVKTDECAWKHLWTDAEKLNNASTPLFSVRAVK